MSQEARSGYVVDIACLRKYPGDQLIEKARAHTKQCALDGHCIESGYGLVDDQGHVTLLDSQATPLIVAVVQKSSKSEGIKVRAMRHLDNGEMQTTEVQEV